MKQRKLTERSNYSVWSYDSLKTIIKILYVLQKYNICIYHKWMSPAVNVKMKKLGPSAVCNIFFDQQGAAQSEYISFLIQLVN